MTVILFLFSQSVKPHRRHVGNAGVFFSIFNAENRQRPRTFQGTLTLESPTSTSQITFDDFLTCISLSYKQESKRLM